MAEVMNLPVDSLHDRNEKSPDEPQPLGSPQHPPAAPPSQQPTAQQSFRKRDRDSRDERDLDRFANRREIYDRNRSPPPPREKEREYRRRGSMSPPPPLYRDRRRSPPLRRSPPFKRPRRDDVGHDPSRGGQVDRRFGYAGGYERDMGGRLGYAEDKFHGRHMGRSSGSYQGGPSDWDSGRFGDHSSTGGNQREGLMSYKLFIHELEDDILPAEAERRYQEYKSEYISTQKRAFFDAHKAEEWLKDKYHPTNLLAVIERRNELARKVATEFFVDLHSGMLDLGPSISVSASNKSGKASAPNSEDETDAVGNRRRHGRIENKEAIISAAPKAQPISSEPRRIQIDIEQAQALVCKLDSEKGIEENILRGSDGDKSNREKSHGGSSGHVIIIRGLSSVKGLEGVELLDTLITYLWRIHGLDYYGMVEASEAKGLRHVRGEGKGADANGAEWVKKLDSRWQERLRGQDPLETMTAKEKIDAAAVAGLDPYVRKIRDEKYGWKYGCGAKSCTKLFHASEFVHKHLKLKHLELIMEVTSKVREELYFQNYMSDPDAPGGTPVMQQPLVRDRLQKRRLGPLKDERGNQRERNNRANGGMRFDRVEQQSVEDGLEGSNNGEPYDTFGAQSIHTGNFNSDIPPPVLMPVPGAGPLGPFVPAPPEVALRMFRDQGGPPFEGGGISSSSRLGPPLNGPAPIILPPGFRADPRRIRSYQDLDTPEDEVTVIDYRSL